MTDEHSTPAARRIDMTRLLEDVVEFIDALVPGEGLVITRVRASIATISNTCPAG